MLQHGFVALGKLGNGDIREPSRIIADATAQMFKRMSIGGYSYEYLQFLIDLVKADDSNGSIEIIASLHPDYDVQAWLRGITDYFVVLISNMGPLSYCEDSEVFRLYLKVMTVLIFYIDVEEMISVDNLVETKYFLEQCKNLKYFTKEIYQHGFQFLISFVDDFFGNNNGGEIERVLDNLT